MRNYCRTAIGLTRSVLYAYWSTRQERGARGEAADARREDAPLRPGSRMVAWLWICNFESSMIHLHEQLYNYLFVSRRGARAARLPTRGERMRDCVPDCQPSCHIQDSHGQILALAFS